MKPYYEQDGITIYHGDCLDVLKSMPADSVDMVLCSPPYEAARTYGIGFNLRGDDWAQWCADRYMECLRLSRGLVAWVVEGQTRDGEWSASPAMLMVELQRRGAILRKPPIYKRYGIPGSGGKDWLKNNYEFIVCATRERTRLWRDLDAIGHPPKFGPGGPPSHRRADGTRASGSKSSDRRPSGELKPRVYVPPKVANPGNVIECGAAGGGNMGHALACENEAPFPLKLAEFFVRGFCPPDGVVLDCFSGSGTTAHAAVKHGRRAVCVDVRESQCELTVRRVAGVSGLAVSAK